MLKIAFKSVYPLIMSLALAVSVAAPAGAADDADIFDTVELKSGDKLTGTFLNDTITVTTPYMAVTLEKDKISEIRINSESVNHDIIVLNTGGLLEGTIEETGFSFKPVSGEIITVEKEQCKKIILKRINE